MAKLFSSFSSSLVWRPSHSCLWTVGAEIKTFVRRESSNSASCCRVWKKKNNLHAEPNSWLSPIRYYAALNWLETIPGPPSLFILHLKNPTAWRWKRCPRHKSQNLFRYDDIKHERWKKSSQISFGTPRAGTLVSQPAAFAVLPRLCGQMYIFLFFMRWGGEDCVASLLERPWCGTNVFSMKQRGSVFFFFLSPAGSAGLVCIRQDFLLPLLYFSFCRFFSSP